jgi:hypothetical protein
MGVIFYSESDPRPSRIVQEYSDVPGRETATTIIGGADAALFHIWEPGTTFNGVAREPGHAYLVLDWSQWNLPGNVIDYETPLDEGRDSIYNVQVRTDYFYAGTNVVDDWQFVITNNVPVNVSPDHTGRVLENARTGTPTGVDLRGWDGAGADARYVLVDNAGGRFQINYDTGVVTVANGALIDNETAPEIGYTITVGYLEGSNVVPSNTEQFRIDVLGGTEPIELNLSGNPDINGLLGGYAHRTYDNFLGQTDLTYSFPQSPDEYLINGLGYEQIVGFLPLNEAQRLAYEADIGILAEFEAVADLFFHFTTDPNADIRFAQATQIDYGPGGNVLHVPGTLPGTAEALALVKGPAPGSDHYVRGDVWFSQGQPASAGTNNSTPTLGDFVYTATFMHELGHALGLKHGHETAVAHGITFPQLPDDHDSQEYSIMTYNTYPNVQANANDYPTTLMVADIAALQYMYGPNTTTNSADTTYRWSDTTGELFINDVGQGERSSNRNTIFMTVWDPNGFDTYDLSNYTNDVQIDLRPGQWTTTSVAQLADLNTNNPGVNMARGNIANALLYQGNTASLIENAFSGSGDDTIMGNEAHNMFNAGGGHDTVDGSAGIDTARFSGLRSGYTLTPLSGSKIQVAGPDGSDILTNVEILFFDDDTVVWQTPTLAIDFGLTGERRWVGGTGDFDGDGTGDILVRDADTGAVNTILVKDGGSAGTGAVGVLSGSWLLAGTGDFNNDGTSDVVLRNASTGNVDSWIVQNGQWSASGAIGILSGAWQFAATGDFNSDGTTDVLIRNADSGFVDSWIVKNGQWSASGAVGVLSGAWQFAAVGDFNGDGTSDVLIRNTGTGQVDAWIVQNGQWSASRAAGVLSGNWQLAGSGDFNGDGTDDVLLRDASTGAIDAWILRDGSWSASVGIGSNEIASQVGAIGDFDNDGVSDLFWQNQANGHAVEWLL